MKKIFSLVIIASVLFFIDSTNINAAGSFWETYFGNKPIEADAGCGGNSHRGVVEWKDLNQSIILNYGGCGDIQDPFKIFPIYSTTNIVFTDVENVDASSSNENIITSQLRPYNFSKEKNDYTELISWFEDLTLEEFNETLEEYYGYSEEDFVPYTVKPTWWEYNELASEPTSWWDFYGFNEDPTNNSVELLTYAKDLGKASLTLTAKNKSPITINWSIWAYGFDSSNSLGLIEILNNTGKYQSLIDEYDLGNNHNFYYRVDDTEDMSNIINALKGKDVKIYISVGSSELILDGTKITSNVAKGFTYNHNISLYGSDNSAEIKKLVELENPVFIEFTYKGTPPIPFDFRYNIASYYYWNDEDEFEACDVFLDDDWEEWDECYNKIIDKRFDYLDKTEFTLLRYNPSTKSVEVIKENIKINPSSKDIEIEFDYLGSYILVTDYSFKQAKKNLKFSSDTNGGIKINFDNIDKASGYKIYRSTDNKKFTLLKEVTTNEYIDSVATANTKYYYKVTSYKVVNEVKEESEDFNIGSYTYKLNAPSVTLSNISTTSIKISYPKVAKASGYEIYRATSKTGKYTLIKSTTALSFTNTGLTFNKTYYYKVRAYNTINGKKVYGAYSSIKSIKALPGAPAVKAASAGYNSIKISYPKVTGATGYEISRYDEISKKWTVVKTTTGVSYTNTSLVTGSEYTYRVRAYKTLSGSKKFGAYSTLIKAIPIPSTPTLSGSSLTSLKIEIKWNKITGATGYKVEIKDESDNVIENFETTNINYNFLNPVINKSFIYKVTAYKEVSGTKIYGKTASVTIKTTPTVAKIINVTTSINKISFNYSKEYDEVIDGFIIKRSTSLTGTYNEILNISYTDAENNGFLFEDSSVTGNKTYYYQIFTYKTIGENKILSVVKNLKSSSVPMVANITLTNVSNTSLKISYPKINGANGYEIYRATSKTGKYTLIKTTTGLSFTNTKLSFNKTYYYKVRVYSLVSGKKVYSTYSSIKSTKVLTAAPTVKAVSAGYNSIKISYPKVSGASGYEISRYDEVIKKWTVVKTTTALSFTNTSLVTGREYIYRVRSYRTLSGKKIFGPYSKQIKATPLPNAPILTGNSFMEQDHLEEVGYEEFENINNSNITITWPKIPGASGYTISIFNEEDTPLLENKNLSSNKYVDNQNHLTLNKAYTYKIKAYTTVSEVKYYSSESTVTLKALPPTPFAQVYTSLDSIVFSIDSSSYKEYAVDGFIVYRRNSEGETPIITTLKCQDDDDDICFGYSHTEEGLNPNTTYYFEIYSYIGSTKSLVKKVTAKTNLMKAYFYAAKSTKNSINLHFLANEGLDGYEIYRSTSQTGKFSLIKTIPVATWDYFDENLSTGKTYYYKVRTFATLNGKKYYSPYSDIIKVKL